MRRATPKSITLSVPVASRIGISIGAGRLSVEYTTRSPAARAPTGGWRRARRLVRAPRGPWKRRSPLERRRRSDRSEVLKCRLCLLQRRASQTPAHGTRGPRYPPCACCPSTVGCAGLNTKRHRSQYASGALGPSNQRIHRRACFPTARTSSGGRHRSGAIASGFRLSVRRCTRSTQDSRG